MAADNRLPVLHRCLQCSLDTKSRFGKLGKKLLSRSGFSLEIAGVCFVFQLSVK